MGEIIRLNSITTVNPVIRPTVQWSNIDPVTHAAISHQLVANLQRREPLPLLVRTYSATPNANKKATALYTKTVQPQKQSRPVSDFEERLHAKNAIARPVLDIFEEEEAEVLEKIFDILVALHKGKATHGLSLFRQLIANQSGILSKFNYHLRNLNEESEEYDSIEFGADMVKTKKALFAIAYNGKNAKGKLNKYFSAKAMDDWFNDLGKILKEEKKQKVRPKKDL